MKIDYVFLYCNSNNEKWINKYQSYLKTYDLWRYIDNLDTIKYSLRSIEKYMLWINNVFMVVDDTSSIPNWMKTDNIKIITHDQIMPQNMLPCFNSIAIEHYISNIDNLSEFFLYGNDDFIALKPLSEDMFFSNTGKLNISIKKLKICDHPFYSDILQNSWKFLYQYYNKKLPEDFNEFAYEQNNLHAFRPNIKSVRARILHDFEDEIIRTFSRTRQKNNMINLEVPYYFLNGHVIEKAEFPEKFHYYSGINDEKSLKCFYDIVTSDNFYTTVINSCKNEYTDNVVDILNKKFDFKSSFEK